VYQTGIGRNLGPVVSLRSREWCMDGDKLFLIHKRYAQPHQIQEDPGNMNHRELLFCIRQSLKIPREELSISEKKLHLNISSGMSFEESRISYGTSAK